jgi:ribosome-binding factor A
MTTRQNRVQELLRAEISEILRRELKDPRMGFVTITDVAITSDMRHARVFVSVLGSDEDRAENLKILKRAEHFIRQTLGSRLSMKTLPEIEFKLDTSADNAMRILELMEQIKHDDEDRSA